MIKLRLLVPGSCQVPSCLQNCLLDESIYSCRKELDFKPVLYMIIEEGADFSASSKVIYTHPLRKRLFNKSRVKSQSLLTDTTDVQKDQGKQKYCQTNQIHSLSWLKHVAKCILINTTLFNYNQTYTGYSVIHIQPKTMTMVNMN